MRRYEQVCILRPSLSEEEISRIIDNTTQLIQDEEGSVIFLNKWGMRKLAYQIKKEIQGWIAQFHENGFSLEQCAIAARGQKVSYDDVLPQITVVQNGYISIVAYQNKGYALLPMD